MNPKERLDEIQHAGRRQRAAARVKTITEQGEKIRPIFATSRCDVCRGPIGRYEAARGFVCVNGHVADKGAAKRRSDAALAKAVKLVNEEHSLFAARDLQKERQLELAQQRKDDLL